MFLEILQSSLETPAPKSFFDKVAGLRPEKKTLDQGFSCEFCEMFKSALFYRTPLEDCFCIGDISLKWNYISVKKFKIPKYLNIYADFVIGLP